MQSFINTYYIEIIGAIAALSLLAIYFVLKTSQKKENNQYIYEDKPKTTPLEVPIARKESKIDIKPVEAAATQLIKRTKRELLLHGKITKEDFEIFRGTKILIAEDNVINQKVIVGLLSASGISITIANNGQEALNILEKNKNFSMIFMDAHMPVLDGFQATREIRKNPNFEHIPVIALSGDTAVDDIKNMLSVGMEAHLEKPLKMDALYDILYAYTTGDEAKNSLSNEHEDEDLKEFDTHMGLEICGGDKKFYLEILHDFISKYSDSAKIIQEYISASDSANASKMLLDISGVAANIGADGLHQLAIDLKSSLSNPTDMEYINNLRKYKRSLQQACEAINEYTNRA
ncbi:MAG: response regulator [Sulfurimonas sp.]|uniref:response regulator n=1 Tax=Sulfurimonas sp. TaxID=2022749 RepID=UPI002607ACC5|nr:hybrid sensor histidine kinase/response regulator [Sulfurimonas sp.]MDD2653450.1 response regulator [Sulfurimonas sp.]MDD3452619.1 response regulator [Sulfurimonas sp.]